MLGCFFFLTIPVASSFADRVSPTDSLYVKITPGLDTSGSWIDRSGPGVKFFIRKDDVYKITKAWLERAGINTATIDPVTVKLFRKGREVPLLPVNLDAGVFSDSSYFLFYGNRNYTEGGYRHLPARLDDPYPEYLNRYSDSTAYWLFFGERESVSTTQPSTNLCRSILSDGRTIRCIMKKTGRWSFSRPTPSDWYSRTGRRKTRGSKTGSTRDSHWRFPSR